MDINDLNMMPAFSENLISYKQNSSDSINDIAGNELPFYDNPEEANNFEQGYQKIFTPFLPDNKEDILNEIHDVNKVEEFIISFQKVLDDYYFDKNYDGIIERIEKRFPYFFNEKTNGLLYIIQKMKFFELLKEDNILEAKQFYQDKLLLLIKEIKKDNWEIKNKFFIKLLNNPKLILKQGDLQKKYYDRYTYQLETAIRNFLHENNKEYDDQNSQDDLPLLNSTSNNAFNHLYSSSSIEVNSLKKSYNNISNINVEYYNDNKMKDIEFQEPIANEENKDDLDLENYSTKEEFSDFEDEIQQKCINNQEQKENKTDVSTIKINDNEDIISQSEFKLNSFEENSPDFSFQISSCQSKLFKSSFEEENNFINIQEQNEFNIDTSTKNLYKNFDNDEPDNKFNDNKNNVNIIHFGEINTNINKIEKENKKKEKKKCNKKNKTKKEETIFSQLPYLNSFKPKYIKRETIDKKIIRLFKNYVIKEYKERRFEIDKKIMDQNFFISLINGNVLPPLEFHEVDTDEYIKFNSFNCSYLLWFFSKKGVKEIYNQFISEKGKEFITDMSQYYEIGTEEEKNQLNTYIMNMPNIFDITLVNNITQGETVMHLYRTVDKNKRIKERQTRKKNDLDLKRLKSNESQRERERSRSRDFDDND